MASYLHEGLVELFRSRPELAAGYLGDVFRIDLPPFASARTEDGGDAGAEPEECLGDAAVALIDEAGVPVAGIVVEVQLHRDESRRWSWPTYVAALRSRLKCPAYLLVVSLKPDVAQWCGGEITMGHPDWILRPLVLGPQTIPTVETDAVLEVPERAVLPAIAHAEGPDAERVLSTLFAGMSRVGEAHSTMFYDVVYAALPVEARRELEIQKGKIQGRARSVLIVLDARGIPVPDDIRARILRCGELGQLDAWLRQAVSAEAIDDLFV
ncbi:hypothetical protein [Nocardia huaxiensis]|uniref:hypothetical protein n=1 Tax=Nocardia huaxiensis TaxID=2755382 RepID=UPI001E60B560|nr:hypothetical protein [Nocardia huaxiensis]UFS98069.1 hypothetical protein LPY97_09295 [Nocardia huaxiensis]